MRDWNEYLMFKEMIRRGLYSGLLPNNSVASRTLDCLRGGAAILVLVSHLRSLFFVDYANAAIVNLEIKVFYFLTGIGHEAVMIFFVLSGYVISSEIFISMFNGSWSWKEYLIKRLTRLYIVLIPALILVMFWDHAGLIYLHSYNLYNGILHEHMLDFSVVDRMNILTGLGNLFFLQGIAVPTFGSNGALWSLANEFWYYLIFPTAVLAIRYAFKKELLRSLKYSILACIMMLFVGKSIMEYFAIWLLGTVAFTLPKIRIRKAYRRRSMLFGSIIFFAFSLMISKAKLYNDMVDLIIGLAVSLLLYLMVSFYRDNNAGQIISRLSRISSFSYTLYVVHSPILVFLYGWAISRGFIKWQPRISDIILGIGITVGIMFYAWLISYITEAKTKTFRRIVMTWLADK